MKFTALTAVASSLLSLGSVMAQPVANPSDLETSPAHILKRCEGPCAIWCDGMAFGPDERTVRNACRACRIVNWINGHNGGCDG
ncbi:hypothetical protein F5X68DRAFT_257455 [Plectosphaerella plurivora]|uniref:Uncharacterized protein n=1 Tax=Plectosphaerella plurivora TaxID=936078 RepID=A0A9P9AIB1_9PEZI|nr:hypothetical protein F5X68DRAFT_257455 [Plectosphaerella plurivora]